MICFYDIAGSIEIEGLPPRGIELIRRAFSIANPKWRSACAMGFDTADIPEFIEYVREMPTGKIHVPRGALDVAKTVLGNEGMELVLRRDLRSIGNPVLFFGASVPLRGYQNLGVDALYRAESGIIVLPPGCGKTRLGVAGIQRFERTALVMVPTLDLVEQWVEQISSLTGVVPGVLSEASENAFEDVVVGTEGSIHHLLLRDPYWGTRFGTFVVDEAHRGVCLTIQACADKINARYRLACTATPDRDDGQGRAVGWTFGQRLLERTIPEMVKAGYLMQVTVETEETFYLGIEKPEGLAFQKYRIRLEKDLTENGGRNSVVVTRAAKEARLGHTTLVLTGRKTHVATLVKMLKHIGIDAEGVTSATAWKNRTKAIQRFRDGSLRVLVATSLADQGLDIPRLSRVLLAFPYRSQTMTTQRSGRVMRIFDLKQDAIVVDFMDSNVPNLESRAKDRLRLYKKLGLKIV